MSRSVFGIIMTLTLFFMVGQLAVANNIMVIGVIFVRQLSKIEIFFSLSEAFSIVCLFTNGKQ
jgi:hypothetical protein